jgi:hypothetical protein
MVCGQVHTKSKKYTAPGSFLISLSPQFFRKILKLPEPTLTFKGEDFREF